MSTVTPLFADLLAKASTAKASSTSSVGTLVFFVVIFGLIYVFFLRPRSQAARRQRDTLMELSAGDEVLTGAGIFGTVLDVEPDRVTLETAPGTRITVLRTTIARRITEPSDNSVAEQNWQDEAHDGVAEAAGWHDPSEHDATEGHETDDEPHGHETDDEPHGTEEEPEADGAPGTEQGGGR
jgi:preprotein translocase subunit YajC